MTSRDASGQSVALVTGARRGIGEAIADRLRRAGMVVVGSGRPRAEAAPAGPGDPYRAADLRDPHAAAALVEWVVAAYGRLDVLVNNAAIELEGTVEQTTPAQWDEILAVNVRAPALLARAAIPHLRAAGGGVILNIASVDGYWAEPGVAAYCASKGALIALSRAIAVDHGSDGIRCCCICPSHVETDMLEQYYRSRDDPQAARLQARALHPLNRIASPDEVAELAAFLAGGAASFLTGHVYVIDGGMTAGRPI